MWLIWFGLLVVVFFVLGMAISAILLRLGKLRTRRHAIGALALPFICAALPLISLAFFSLAAGAFGFR